MLDDDSVINERLSNETTCEEAMLGGVLEERDGGRFSDDRLQIR